MSKTLLLIRHAKSDWNNLSLSDFDRPLNGRGKKDAPVMARRLLDKKIQIDAFISSPAKRARETAAIFAHEYQFKKEDISLAPELYRAGEEIFYSVIKNTKNKFDCIAVFSHNPGITDFANLLADTKVDHLPTCGIFAIKIDCTAWQDFHQAPKDFLFFDYPKTAG